MFLTLLTLEQKKLFLSLAKYLANIDNHIHEDEKYLLTFYCYEMNIDDKEITSDYSPDFDEIINKFDSHKSRKILFLEILALILADGEYNEKEKIFLDELVIKLQLDHKMVPIYFNWAMAMTALSKQGQNLIEI